MFSMLKAMWTRLAGASGTGSSGEPDIPAVEYKGYRIRPAPYLANGQYQTAGVIEKDAADGVKEHRFVRADTHSTKDAAIEFAVSKAKQIIDSQHDGMFR
ncbi:MAG: HlyU family transcriptional regulator [Hyphomicrobiales bacterium]